MQERNSLGQSAPASQTTRVVCRGVYTEGIRRRDEDTRDGTVAITAVNSPPT